MKAYLLLNKFHKKNGSFTKTRRELKEDRGLTPVYSHSELLLEDGTFFKAGLCTVMGYGDVAVISKDWTENCQGLIVEVEIEATIKEMKQRFIELDPMGCLKTWEAMYFAETGECIASKELRAFSCGPLVAYLLGYEDYYKVDSDELVDRVVNTLVHYK